MPTLRTLDKTGETVITGRSWPLLRAGKPTDYSFTAVSGTTTTAVLPSGASTRADDYKDLYFVITAGTGSGQAAVLVSASVGIGAGQVRITFATLSTAPDATSVCRLFLAEKYALQLLVEDSPGIGIGAGSLTDEQNGTSDGYTFMKHGIDASTKSCPFAVDIGAAAGAGTFGSTGAKGVRLTAVYGSTETTGSLEATVTITATTDEITVTWEEDGAPDSIRIYGTDTPGTYGASSLVDEIAGGIGTYTWTGTSPGAGQPPSANTTGGPSPTYGVPPAMVTTALAVPALKKGQQFFYWENRSVPSGTPAAGNTRSSIRHFVETG
jgi:hypothetical protein